MKMGESRVTVRLHGPKGSRDLVMVADTGATLTIVPESVAKSIGISQSGSVMAKLADGSQRSCPVGQADVEIRGDRATVRVILGSDDEVSLLGLTALETLGLRVNPIERTLEPAVFNQFCHAVA